MNLTQTHVLNAEYLGILIGKYIDVGSVKYRSLTDKGALLLRGTLSYVLIRKLM